MADKSTYPDVKWARKLLLMATVLSALSLVFQFSSPLNSGPLLPGWVNAIFLSLLVLGLGVHALRASDGQRAAIFAIYFSVVSLFVSGDLCLMPSSMQLASFWGASLSCTLFGVPLVGLLHGGAMISLGWVCTHLLLIVGEEQSRAVRTSAASIGFLITGLGVHALMGYVSGNSSFLPA